MNTTDAGGEFPRPDQTVDTDAADRFVARARVDHAVRERRRAASTVDRALQQVDLVGAMLGARGLLVTLRLSGATGAAASDLTGTIGTVGADVVELLDQGRVRWVALGAISAVETAGPLAGDPSDRSATSLGELVADLVDSGRRPSVRLSSGSVLSGEVRAAGSSLLMQLDDPDRHAVVAWEHVAVVTVRRSD